MGTNKVKDISVGFLEQTEKYRENYKKYGYSERSMFMPSDRRVIRYYELLKNFEFFQKRNFSEPVSICDAGCGFGDLNFYLRSLGMKDYSYIGLDVIEEFMQEGRNRYGKDGVTYLNRNFITEDISDLHFDYAVSSQTFTLPYTGQVENYEVIYESVGKLFAQCNKGVSFNFFTDRGQFQKEGTAYHDPER